MERKNIIKIGLLVVLALVILVWGLSFLKGERLFKTENEYIAVYNRLDGLAESSPVMLSGYKIGSVKSIGFHESDNELKIVVKMSVSNDFNLPKGTTAKIVNVDIMGTKGVEIIRPKKFSDYHTNGDTLRSAIDDGIIGQVLDFVMPMKDDLAGFLSASDSVMHALNQLLNDENRNNLGVGISNLRKVSEHLGNNAYAIDSIMHNFNSLSKTLGGNSKNIDHAIHNFVTLSDSLAAVGLSKTIDEANDALQRINILLSTVNDGNGTVQQLLSNDTLYFNLQAATDKINVILDEFEKHPKKYINLSIFGGKEKDDKKSKKSESVEQ